MQHAVVIEGAGDDGELRVGCDDEGLQDAHVSFVSQTVKHLLHTAAECNNIKSRYRLGNLTFNSFLIAGNTGNYK